MKSSSLYIHIPWCVRKCPYCDFNSHQLDSRFDEQKYLHCILDDFQKEWDVAGKQALTSIFIGGGTPSVMSGGFYQQLFAQIDKITGISDIEITLEANPGTVDAVNFADYRRAGINRLSIGVQSFDNQKLAVLGRIHDDNDVEKAFAIARQSGFDNINMDLMFALPAQTVQMAFADLQRALALAPEHLSWYQLTVEPNTAFFAKPPEDIPDDDLAWDIQQAGQQQLKSAGYIQYEISAYAREKRQCEHNLNYWQFGDYIGIGAGAHGKLTGAAGKIVRTSKKRGPADYMQGQYVSARQEVARDEVLLEYLMNSLRLQQGFEVSQAAELTGLAQTDICSQLAGPLSEGLMTENAGYFKPTEKGHRFLNELLGHFV